MINNGKREHVSEPCKELFLIIINGEILTYFALKLAGKNSFAVGTPEYI